MDPAAPTVQSPGATGPGTRANAVAAVSCDLGTWFLPKEAGSEQREEGSIAGLGKRCCCRRNPRAGYTPQTALSWCRDIPALSRPKARLRMAWGAERKGRVCPCSLSTACLPRNSRCSLTTSCPLPIWGPRGWRPACPGSWGVSLCRGGFGRSIQDFWFRTFPLHSEKEGRKRGMEGGGGGRERNLSTPPTSTFGETEKGFFTQHKTLKTEKCFFFFFFLFSHNTNFSWSPGVTPSNSESRGSRWPSALRRWEEGRRDPTGHTTHGWAPRRAPCWCWPGAGSGTGQPRRRTDQPCSPMLGVWTGPADQPRRGALPQVLRAHPGKFYTGTRARGSTTCTSTPFTKAM